MTKRPLVSIITPAFNESANLPVLHERLKTALAPIGEDWEWIVVDDHSRDHTYEAACALKAQDERVKVYRLAHNSGSHAAMSCGFQNARGDCAVLMAADLQDPPELVPQLMEAWKKGSHIVWAVRRLRHQEGFSDRLFSGLYYFIMRKVVGIKEMPAKGADFFLLSRPVLDALKQFRESNVSMLVLITWLGFRQSSLEYDKQARLHGRSGWSFEKKVKLVIDSVTSFSYLPIRAMSYGGVLIATVGFVYAGSILLHLFSGNRPEGWASLMVVVLVIGGLQMVMIGMLGEYVWRTLEESRRRPRYLIEASTEETR